MYVQAPSDTHAACTCPAAHMHALAPASEDMPAAQTLHTEAPAAPEYVPAVQFEHVAAAALENLPVTQFEHAVAPAPEYLPALQFTQTPTVPTPGSSAVLYVPAAQIVHTTPPQDAAVCPTLHVHLLSALHPTHVPPEPAGQAVHAETYSTAEYVPAAQSEHAVALAGENLP